MVQKRKITRIGVLFIALIIGMNIGSIGSVSTEEIVDIIEEFESVLPEGWTSTGWLWKLYGIPHNGSGWLFSWAAGDTLTTKTFTFTDDTELSFWYASENSAHPMGLEVYIDNISNQENMIWNHTGFTHTEYHQANVNLSNYPGKHSIIFVGKTSDMYGQMIDDFVLTSILEEDDDSNGNGGNGSPPQPPDENEPPVANASKGAQYQGITRETIQFDGRYSSDSDGKIISYKWDFGDNTSKSGSVVYHSYQTLGTYTITLTVTDDDGAEDSDIFTLEIKEGNNPPSTPELKASDEPLLTYTNYTFFVISTDVDNNTISYLFDWGDTTNTTTEFFQSDMLVNTTHQWMTPGLYIITVKAMDDQNAFSEVEQEIVFIEIYKEFIDDEISGYLIEYNNVGNFTHFYNLETGVETLVQQMDSNAYLIDENGDAQWDYEYNEIDGLIPYQSGIQTDNGDETETSTPGFELILLMVSIAVFYIFKKKIHT